jgi:two-component system response regulator
MIFRDALKNISPATRHQRVRDGQELLDYLYASSLPDLIVLDLRMPRMDGEEALRAIRQNPVFRSVPVIVLSIWDDEVEKTALRGLGIDGYFVKPKDYDESARFIKEFSRYGFQVSP